MPDSGFRGVSSGDGTEIEMQPMQKAGEPSMEEILASIRKIISEDPSGAVPAKGPVSPPPQPTPSPAVAPGPSLPTRLSGAPSQAPRPAQQPAPMSLEKELADLLREPVELPPAARAPVPPAARPPQSGQPQLPVPSSAASAPAASSAVPPSGSVKEPEIPSGLTAWFRGKTSPAPAALSPQLPSIAGDEPTEVAARPVAPEPQLPPAAEPVAEVRHAALSPASADVKVESVVKLSAPKPDTDLHSDSLPTANVNANANANMQAILGRLTSAAATPPSHLSPTLPKARAFPAAEQKASEAPAQIAPHGTGPAPATKSEFPLSDPVALKPLVPDPAASTVTIPDKAAPAQSHSAAPEPSAIAITAEAIAASAPAAIAAAAAASLPARDTSALEDSLADLLRPMVRQWLDENMRGALERALREEIASKKAKPSG